MESNNKTFSELIDIVNNPDASLREQVRAVRDLNRLNSKKARNFLA